MKDSPRGTQFLTLQAVEKAGVKLPVRSADLLSPVVFGGQGTEGDSSWHGAAPPCIRTVRDH